MTEIQFSEKEISHIFEEVVGDYLKHYQADKMTFSEFAIIENFLIKCQMKFKELNAKKESEQ